MPYVPGLTPILCNMGDVSFVFKAGGKSVSVKPYGCVNLDVFALRDSAYINSKLGKHEKAGIILFSSSDVTKKHKRGIPHDESAFTKSLDVLIEEGLKKIEAASRRRGKRKMVEEKSDGNNIF